MQVDVALLAIAVGCSLALFASPAQLRGPLLYDDKAAVLQMPVVMGTERLERVWHVDFWGRDLDSPESHKSWRPLVTVTYAANYAWHGPEPYGYHAVNAALHSAVVALIVPTAHAALQGATGRFDFAPGLASLFFAVHPVHVEAVQNIVGRAELMMSILFLSGFLIYVHAIRTALSLISRGGGGGRSVGGTDDGGKSGNDGSGGGAGAGAVVNVVANIALQAAGVVGALGLTLGAMLCKETGATLPLLCVVWDVVVACECRQYHRRNALPRAVARP